MARFAESRGILWLSAAFVAAAHGLILFAWTPATNTPGVLLDAEPTEFEVDLVASSDQQIEESPVPPEETPAPPEPIENPTPEPTPIPEETPAPIEETILPEPEPAPTATPAPSRPPPPSVNAPKKKPAVRSSGPKPPAPVGNPTGSRAPGVVASQASYAVRPSLIYPAESRKAREEGTVVLRITVDAGGRPTSVVVLEGSGYPRLDRAAIEAARRCRIKNAKAGMMLDVPLRFHLDE